MDDPTRNVKQVALLERNFQDGLAQRAWRRFLVFVCEGTQGLKKLPRCGEKVGGRERGSGGKGKEGESGREWERDASCHIVQCPMRPQCTCEKAAAGATF